VGVDVESGAVPDLTQLWSPTLVKDIDCLEQIQRRATNLVHSIKDLNYSEQLQKLRLTTLKTSRRLRGDLIETYKIITGKECIDPQHLFTFANPPYGLQGHSLKLYKHTVRLNIRKNFFSQRIIDHWNKLNQYVVDAPSTNSFKNRLDKHWSKSDMGI